MRRTPAMDANRAMLLEHAQNARVASKAERVVSPATRGGVISAEGPSELSGLNRPYSPRRC